MSLDAVLEKIDGNLDAALGRLGELIAIPSVSTDPAHKGDCARAAAWLADHLSDIGIDASVRETPGHPMVVGHAGPKDAPGPHVLFYGHYDVQPVDPLSEWHTDPFGMEVEDTPGGRVLRARGTADDKGQFMTFVEALRAWREIEGEFPLHMTFLFEGEEESGSPSLVPFLEAHREELAADLCLICDTAMFDRDTPGIVTMLRGMVEEEVVITGPNRDLHSGFYGGPGRNPIRVLSGIIAALHDADGRVTVPGFYDGVDEISDALRAQWDALGFDPASFLGEVGLSHPAGETGRSVLEMIWSRPTCEVNGISGGYAGAGFKTVLPSKASAKISFRLVGRQDPETIRGNFRAMVQDALPPDCEVAFHDHGGGRASVMAVDHPAFAAARAALSDEWPRPAAFIGCGGSIPIAGHFQDILGMSSMLIGFGQSDDALHSPNEKYDLASFHKGARSWARILAALAG